MKEKFIYCFSKNMACKLKKEKYDLISHTTYKGKEAWIFVNNNKISFKKDELEMILFSNRLYC